MPRRRTLPQDCIVCAEPEPCLCTKKPEKAKVPRPRKPEPVITTPAEVEVAAAPPKPSAVGAMRQAAQAGELDDRKDLVRTAVSKTDLGEDDALTVAALRNLGEHFDLDGEDVEKYRRHLDREPPVGERSAAWRARRRAL